MILTLWSDCVLTAICPNYGSRLPSAVWSGTEEQLRLRCDPACRRKPFRSLDQGGNIGKACLQQTLKASAPTSTLLPNCGGSLKRRMQRSLLSRCVLCQQKFPPAALQALSNCTAEYRIAVRHHSMKSQTRHQSDAMAAVATADAASGHCMQRIVHMHIHINIGEN